MDFKKKDIINYKKRRKWKKGIKLGIKGEKK